MELVVYVYVLHYTIELLLVLVGSYMHAKLLRHLGQLDADVLMSCWFERGPSTMT